MLPKPDSSCGLVATSAVLSQQHDCSGQLFIQCQCPTFTNNMAGSHMFSTLNLVKGHYQVEMFPDDILKTTISTPFGLFEFLLMPFG